MTPYEEARALVDARVRRGSMPKEIGQLLERRGTIEGAAQDLAQFSGLGLEHCRQAIEEFYGTSH